MTTEYAEDGRDYAEAGRVLLGNLNIDGTSRFKRQISEGTQQENDLFENKLLRVNFLGARKPGVVPAMWSVEEDGLLKQAVDRHGDKKWRAVAEEVPGRNHLQCLQRWRKALRPGLIKGHWSKEEDRILLELIADYTNTGKVASINWASVSSTIPGRNAKQCRERWFLNLDPSINRGPWTPDEDRRLVELAQQCGGRWSLIAKNMDGRTENAVKTRFQSLQRQQARSKGWSPEEDQIILDATLQLGRDWGKVVKHLPGRSRGQLKKRFVILTQQRPDLVRQIQLVEEALAQGQPPPYNPRYAPQQQPQQDMNTTWTDLPPPAPSDPSKKKGMFKKYGSSWMAGIVDNLEPPPPQHLRKGMYNRTNSQKVLDSVIGGGMDERPYQPSQVSPSGQTISRRSVPRHDTLGMIDRVLVDSETSPSIGLEAYQDAPNPKGLRQSYSSWGSIGTGQEVNNHFTNIFSQPEGPPPATNRRLQKMQSSGLDQWTQQLSSYESTADFKNFLQML